MKHDVESLRNALLERERLDPDAPKEIVMPNKVAEKNYAPDLAAFRAEFEGRFKPIKGFVIEEEFQTYCKRAELNIDACDPVQGIEMRRTFYGAVGQLLMYFRDDLAEESEDDGVMEMERIWQQVRVFWERQAKSR